MELVQSVETSKSRSVWALHSNNKPCSLFSPPLCVFEKPVEQKSFPARPTEKTVRFHTVAQSFFVLYLELAQGSFVQLYSLYQFA